MNLGLTFLGILLFLTSVFMMLLILVQRGKGGGLTGALGGMGGQSAFGSKAGDVFTRITVITAMIWITLCMITIAAFNPPPVSDLESQRSGSSLSGVEDEEEPSEETDTDSTTELSGESDDLDETLDTESIDEELENMLDEDMTGDGDSDPSQNEAGDLESESENTGGPELEGPTAGEADGPSSSESGSEQNVADDSAAEESAPESDAEENGGDSQTR